jgi:hypothetical protein
MIKIKDSTVLLSWTSHVLLSIYSALLIVSLDAEKAGFSWAIKLRLFYITRYQPHFCYSFLAGLGAGGTRSCSLATPCVGSADSKSTSTS